MKKGLAFALLLAFVLAACEKEEKQFDRSFYVNKDAVCCGVENPIENLSWLNEEHIRAYDEMQASKEKSRRIFLLYRNDTTGEDNIVELVSRYTLVYHYDCNGNGEGGYYNFNDIPDVETQHTGLLSPPAPCQDCDTFFRTHYFVDTLAYYKVQPLN